MLDTSTDGFAPGQSVGPYRIASVCAPYGAVAEVVDPTTHLRSALKRLRFDLVADKVAWRQFRQYVESVRAWKHPNAIAVHGVETYDGRPYSLMEFAAKLSLADAVSATGRLPWRAAVQRTIEAGRAVAAAHAAGIVHGSIRPSNLLLMADNTLKVSDFGGGFARPRTRDYSAPESFAGRPADAAGDVYSLGATFFALLTGHAPFGDAETAHDLAKAHATRPIPNVRAGVADMPLRCEMIINRAMAKAPADRYPSVAAFVADLESLLRPEPPTAPPRRNPQPTRPPRRPWRRSFDWQRWLTPLLLVVFLGGATYLSFFHNAKPAPRDSAKSAPVPPRPTIRNSIGMSLVELPAATFILGDPEVGDAKPHMIRITRPFLIGQMEVRQREYQAVFNANPSRYPDESNPVEMVSWDEAAAFCKRLSELPLEIDAGRRYRLPTEAEWEFACRAGTRTRFAFGPLLSVEQANFGGSFRRTSPGGTYPFNRFGLHDVHGNVWEWCSDWYSGEYYSKSPTHDPAGPAKGTARVVRGGSFMSPPESCRSSTRKSLPPTSREPDVGFRVVCTIEDKPK